jgi:hypothetical protein
MPGRGRERRSEFQPTLAEGELAHRPLNQAANAAVKHKGSIFEMVYRRLFRASATTKLSGQLRIASVS